MSTVDHTTPFKSNPVQTEPGDDLVPRPRAPLAEDTRLRDIRVPYARVILAVACVAVFSWLLYASRRWTFIGDEWDFLVRESGWTPLDYLRPHNEHWSTIPMISYKIMLNVFGAGSYLPFMAVLLVAHVANVALVYAIVRRRAGELIGLVCAGLVLLVARGAENLTWAFQIAFIGSITFGLLAIYVLDGADRKDGGGRADRWRGWAATAALLASLACSGIGVFMVVTVAGMILLDRGRRRLWWVLATPIVVYGAWYLAFGRAASEVHRSPYTLEAVNQLISYVPTGIAAGVSATLSLGPRWGLLSFAAAVAVFVLMATRRQGVSALAIGAIAGMVFQFAFTGLVRAQFGDDQATSSRYLYIAAFYLVLIFGEALGTLPSGVWWRRAVVAAVALIVVNNVLVMSRAIDDHDSGISELNSALQTGWLLRDAPGLQPAGRLFTTASPSLEVGPYIELRRARGSGLPEPTVADLANLQWPVVNQMVRYVLPMTMTVGDAPSASTDSAGPKARLGTCEDLGPGDPIADAPRIVHKALTDDSVVTITTGTGRTVTVTSTDWVLGEGPDAPAEQVGRLPVKPTQMVTLRVPSSGLRLVRNVEITVPSGTAPIICTQNAA